MNIWCPYCNRAINLSLAFSDIFCDQKNKNYGYRLGYNFCPSCNKLIIYLIEGVIVWKTIEDSAFPPDYEPQKVPEFKEIKSQTMIYPNFLSKFAILDKIPEDIKKDLYEAALVLSISPKASAALSRRLLEKILREKFSIKENKLSKMIGEFLTNHNPPSYLSKAIDAIREIGNLAAHPIKNENIGEIVDVEPGEAEWILEVLYFLVDFAYIKPKEFEEKREMINKKLIEMGRNPLKE